MVVKDNQILCTGYVGAPPGFPHCDDVGHELAEVTEDGVARLHCVRTIHAEANAVIQAAGRGVPLLGATFYCTMEPCRVCAYLIIGVGASRVVALRRYRAGEPARRAFTLAGIELAVRDDEEARY